MMSDFFDLYGALESPSGIMLWDESELPAHIDENHTWSVVDCDGKLYLSAGFHIVNCIGYVLCAKPYNGNTESVFPYHDEEIE